MRSKPARGISPHFGGGSGLKLSTSGGTEGPYKHLPSLRWGERIETCSSPYHPLRPRTISPHFGGGSGLKLYWGMWTLMIGIISPHFGGGSGLKLPGHKFSVRCTYDLPSLRWGERIETSR